MSTEPEIIPREDLKMGDTYYEIHDGDVTPTVHGPYIYDDMHRANAKKVLRVAESTVPVAPIILIKRGHRRSKELKNCVAARFGTWNAGKLTGPIYVTGDGASLEVNHPDYDYVIQEWVELALVPADALQALDKAARAEMDAEPKALLAAKNLLDAVAKIGEHA